MRNSLATTLQVFGLIGIIVGLGLVNLVLAVGAVVLAVGWLIAPDL